MPPIHWVDIALLILHNLLMTDSIVGVKEIVLKAQILAGGRGKGVFDSGLHGGVKVTSDIESIGELSKQMIGYKLKTKQTPNDGVMVNKVWHTSIVMATRLLHHIII